MAIANTSCGWVNADIKWEGTTLVTNEMFHNDIHAYIYNYNLATQVTPSSCSPLMGYCEILTNYCIPCVHVGTFPYMSCSFYTVCLEL